jgi:prepilin-type N-terminal cleavage/methylation domain-containing protein/prepilin-type processing-associated H-X9-DG protein
MNVIDGEMRFSCNKKLSRAFTLVELLVVISVIGLLMGILVPALGKARGVANRTYCMANLNQLGIAMRSYLDDNRDIFPICAAFPWFVTDSNAPGYAPPITKTLGLIVKEPKVFICKADNIKKYYLRVGNTSYQYNAFLAGITLKESPLVQSGAKERDMEVMSDFDAVHPGKTGTFRTRQGQKNYLYADWHVSNYVKQE